MDSRITKDAVYRVIARLVEDMHEASSSVPGPYEVSLQMANESLLESEIEEIEKRCSDFMRDVSNDMMLSLIEVKDEWSTYTSMPMIAEVEPWEIPYLVKAAEEELNNRREIITA